MAVNEAVLAKIVDGVVEYIYPKTSSNIVEYVDGMTVKDKLDSLTNSGSLGYAICDTAADTAAKVVTTETEFDLHTGASLMIRFTYANTTDNPTLNINDTGTIALMLYGTTRATSGSWRAGELLEVTYDGTYWVIENGSIADSTYYGVTKLTDSTSSTSTSTAATPNSVKEAYDAATAAQSAANSAQDTADAAMAYAEATAYTHPTVTPDDTTSTAAPAAGETFTAIDTVIRDNCGHVTGVNTKTVTMPEDTTYEAGTGLSLSGNTFNHSNSVTAGTASGSATSTLDFGDTFDIPTVTYDSEGHITGTGTTTITMPANPDTDTTYSAGTGISIDGTTINHSNSITAGTASGSTTGTLNFGDTFDMPTVDYDAQGHITGNGTTTMTMPSVSDSTSSDSSSVAASSAAVKAAMDAASAAQAAAEAAQSTANEALTDAEGISYEAGTGLSLNGNVFNHSNSVTAGTASGSATGTLSYGGTFNMPTVTYDSEGHITASGTTTMTMPSVSDSTSSDSDSTAASSAAVKAAMDAASAAQAAADAAQAAADKAQATADEAEGTAEGISYSAGTGLTLNGTTFNHSNSVTAGTASGTSTSTVAYGGSFNMPTVTYDAQGHITGSGTTTITMPSISDSTVSDSSSVAASSAAVKAAMDAASAAQAAADGISYSAGTGLSLNGTTFNHSNSVTAGTASGSSTGSLSYGGTFNMPTVSYDAQGHITGNGTTTMTMPSISDSTSSTSTTVAASSAAVKAAMDAASAAQAAAEKAQETADAAEGAAEGISYSAGTGLSLSGTTFNHSNSVTAGTASGDSSKTLTFGSTFKVPSVTYDAQGHITSTTTTTMTMPANPDTDTTYSAGTGLSLSGTTFNHSNSVTAGTASGSSTGTLSYGGTFNIPTISYDAQGHITGTGTTTMTMPAAVENTDTVYTAGTGISISSANVINHSNSITAGTASGTATSTLTHGGTFTVPTISYDAQGHITGTGTNTLTLPADNNTTYSAGTGLSLSGTTFNHSNSVTAGTVSGDSSKTLSYGGTFKVPSVTYDAQGHITSTTTTTMTMPAAVDLESLGGIFVAEYLD